MENVRLFEAEQKRTRELSEALEQQTATSEVLKVISSVRPTICDLCSDAMLENSARICEAKFGQDVLYADGATGVRIVAHLGVPRHAHVANCRCTAAVPPAVG